MTNKTKKRAFSRVADVDAGAISREIFVNEDIYQQDQHHEPHRGRHLRGAERVYRIDV